MKLIRTHRNEVPAFTLVELILAIGVAAIVLIAINAVFFSALRLREATTDAVDAETPIDRALTFIRRDLQCAVPPPVTNGVLSGDFKAGEVSTIGVADTVNLEIFTATGALSADPASPWGDIQRVTYGLKSSLANPGLGKDLIRTVTRNLLSEGTPDVEEQWMLGGVASLQVQCYDGAQWNDQWDTTQVGSSNTNLPNAVRVKIQMASGNGGARPEPIQLLVPIDSQSRTNS